MTRRFRTYAEVPHETASGLLEQVLEQRARLRARLSDVRRIVAVVSGKGGVGKSAITANLATRLAASGQAVGAVDADLNGPSLGRMLGAAGARLVEDDDGVHPAIGAGDVRVMSMDLLLEVDDAPLRWKGPAGDAFIWRGTAEAGAVREFLSDVVWGPLDWLLIDVPPGTDRIERLLDLVPQPDAVLLVTTPSEISRSVVARSARLLADADVPRVGLVANMTAYLDDAGAERPLFGADGAARLAADSGLDLWARIPFEPAFASATDAGAPPAADGHSVAARAIGALAARLRLELEVT
jgi:ATP-binding protein involved in chromosome partitioning